MRQPIPLLLSSFVPFSSGSGRSQQSASSLDSLPQSQTAGRLQNDHGADRQQPEQQFSWFSTGSSISPPTFRGWRRTRIRALAAAAGHLEFRGSQPPRLIRVQHRFNLATDPRNDPYPSANERSLKPFRNRSADQNLCPQFDEAASDLSRPRLKERDFPAPQFLPAFKTHGHESRSDIKHRRNAALTIGNRDEHDRKRCDFRAMTEPGLSKALLAEKGPD